MKLINKIEIIIKKSRFISYYYEINTIEEINKIILELKKEHKKAAHFPYAYKIDNQIKKSDDKEPSGTAGMPIYTVIDKNNLNNILIVVVRYFGGIKLGAGGLFRAYLKGASEVIKKV